MCKKSCGAFPSKMDQAVPLGLFSSITPAYPKPNSSRHLAVLLLLSVAGVCTVTAQVASDLDEDGVPDLYVRCGCFEGCMARVSVASAGADVCVYPCACG